MLPRPSHDRPPHLPSPILSILLAACGLAACRGEPPQPGPAGSAAPASSAAPAATASAAHSAKPAGSSGASTPRGAGVSAFTPIGEVAACKAKTGELANYLQRQELALAGRATDGQFAAAWLVQMQNNPDAQIAFAGFDGEARQVARARSISPTREGGVRLFETGGLWAMTWFGAEGLTYGRPRWEAIPPPDIRRLTTVGKGVSDNAAIAASPGGALVAVAPFGPAQDQMGLFQFAPTDAAQPAVKAIGATHHTKRPRRPAVAADAGGYFVAWNEDDGSIHASRFDLTGKEGDAYVIAPPTATSKTRERLALITTEGAGALASWIEGDTIVTQVLDGSARASAAPYVIGKGASQALVPSGKGAFVAWIGNDGKMDGQILLARLSADGAPSAQGLRISDGPVAGKDPLAVAAAGERIGVAWTEPSAPGVSTKRAVLRVLDTGCIP